MSFDSQMIHTCVIERDPTNGEDLHGNAPVNQDPELIYSGICRLVEKTERVLREKGGGTVITVYKLLIPPGTMVFKKDRVKSVTLEDLTVLEDAFVVNTAFNRRSSHLAFYSLDLERVS